MIPATALASILAFLVVLHLSGVLRAARGSVGIAREAVATLRDDSVDDGASEAAMRDASRQLFRASAAILLRGALAGVASLLPIWLADVAGVAAAERVIAYLARWETILAATLLICAGYGLKARLWPST